MLQVDNITKTFSSYNQKVTPIKNLSFTLETGTFASIIGKSGSGKSTLLSLLGALDSPSQGKIFIDKTNIAKLKENKLSKYRLQDIGFVFQQYNLIPNLTAVENVMLPLEFAKMPAIKRKKRAMQLLKEVGITPEKCNRKANRLSGGEQQRVSIARALANKPKLILADEPTGNLDEETAENIILLLESLCKLHQTTVLIVTHDVSIAKRTDHIFHLTNQTLVQKK